MLFANAHEIYTAMSKKLKIEVAYALPQQQKIISLEVVFDCTIEEAIQQSGILTLFPEIDLHKQKIGVFSKIKKLNDKVHENDRIEIYRPLMSDPKEKRRQRAKLKNK